MKLVINYDLINEINKANTGINLKRFNTKMGIYLSTITALNLSTLPITDEINIPAYLFGLTYALILYGGTELITKNFNKYEANDRLNSLASSFSKINIYTDADSIKNAYLYKTKYKLVRYDKSGILQTKFIMLPTTGTLNADEVSLQQDHIIGSREYVLSIGEPKKETSKILSRAIASYR